MWGFKNLLGDIVSGLGYAASGWAGHPVQIVKGGLGQAISGAQNPQSWNPFNPKGTFGKEPPPPPPQNNSGGGVLGAKTSGNSGGSSQPQSQPQNNNQPQNNQPSFNPDEEAKRQAEEAARQKAEYEAKVRSGIESAYAPVFSELDRQVGLVPGQKEEFIKQVADLATSQAGEVGIQKESSAQGLEAQKGVEEGRAADSFRTLEEDLRNMLSASSQYFGSKGAADSSAPGAASEAFARAAQKSKASILSTRNSALAAIDSKVQDVKTLADTQLNKIDQWKATKLLDVTQWATDRINSLNSEKLNATGQKGQAIANLIADTEKDFITRLRQLDDSVTNYKASVSQWQTQRAADLEDFKTKLGIQAQYTTTTPAQYKIVTDALGQTFAVNPTNPSDTVPISGQLMPKASGLTKPKEDTQSAQPVSLMDAFNLKTPVVPTVQ